MGRRLRIEKFEKNRPNGESRSGHFRPDIAKLAKEVAKYAIPSNPDEKETALATGKERDQSLAIREEKQTATAIEVSAGSLATVVDVQRDVLCDLLAEHGVPLPARNGYGYRSSDISPELLKCQLDRSEFLTLDSLSEFAGTLDESRKAAFLGGVFLDNKLFKDEIRLQALLLLIVSAAESEESRTMLQQFGFTDQKISEYNHEITAKGPKFNLDQCIAEATVGAGGCGGFGYLVMKGWLSYLLPLDLSPEVGIALMIIALPVGAALPLFNQICGWLSNPNRRRNTALAKATDEVEQFKALLCGEPSYTQRRVEPARSFGERYGLMLRKSLFAPFSNLRKRLKAGGLIARKEQKEQELFQQRKKARDQARKERVQEMKKSMEQAMQWARFGNSGRGE